MPNLTKRLVDAVKPPPKGGPPVFVWDADTKGFGLLVMPSGTKSYIVQYRNQAGRSRRYTIGRHGTFAPDEARAEARQLLAAIALGEDPLDDREARRRAATVGELLNRYLAEHVAPHNAATTAAEATRVVERHLRPALGHLKVSAIGSADLAKLHTAMRATPRLANHVLSIASKAFALAETWQMRPQFSNPARGIRRFAEHKRKTQLTDLQLGALGAALLEAETIGLVWDVGDEPSKHLPKDPATWRSVPNRTAMIALRLLLFTGARLSEILELRWDHVDLDRGTFALPVRKGGVRQPHPAGDTTIEIVRKLSENPLPAGRGFSARKRQARSPWVLPREGDPKRHVSKETVEKVWQQLRRRAGLDEIRIHDLRHAFGTFAGQGGGNAFLIRDLLRHENLTMTNRYVAADADPIRAAMKLVEARIVRGLDGVLD